MTGASATRTRSRLLAPLGLLLLIEVAAVLLWAPSILWPFTVSWDENTFYLVAQRLLSGELPYTTTFENKSPLTLVPQTLVMFVTGPNPELLRLAAALILGFTAFFLISVSPGRRMPVPAFLTAALFLVAWVSRPNGLVWMSELNIALVFSITLFVVLKVRLRGMRFLFLAGFLIGCLPLFRINWSFVALTLFVFAAMQRRSWMRLVTLACGSVVPLLGIVMIYGIRGSIERLWAGSVLLPRELGNGEGWRFPTLFDDQLPLGWLLCIVIVTSLLLAVMQIHRTRGERVESLDPLLLISAWALTFGAWIQPYDFPYQTLQMLPFVALSVGRVFAVAPRFRAAISIPVFAACLTLLYFVQVNVFQAFDWRNQARQEVEITAAVAELADIESKSLWIPDDSNFLYWRLGKVPVVPLASMPYLVWDPGGQRAFRGFAVPEYEASENMFDQQPDLVIARSDYQGSYTGTEEARRVWQETLATDYFPVLEVHGRTVWERRAPSIS